ncbi:MAG: peptidoglycan recognition family protein [Chloroflexota bacterium]|nr:peptidoglycan recognition family protein [Chloroflexota bacterium]
MAYRPFLSSLSPARAGRRLSPRAGTARHWAQAQAGESRYLVGFHDPGGEAIMLEAGKPGWVLVTEAIGRDPGDQSGGDYSNLADQGLGVIVRLNNGYGSTGTIPLPQHYDAFAQRCANFVANSLGCRIWVIGNEMNHEQERPEGQPITPKLYAQCFSKCRSAIKAQAGDAHKVVVGAVAPYNATTTYPGNESGDWIKYFSDILTYLRPDGIALHAYTWRPDPSLVTSEERMDPPFDHLHKQFRTYRDFMGAIPEDMRDLPVYITEADQMGRWEDVNNGWVQAVYEEIDNWNRRGKQQIHCVILYRWSTADQWSISGKHNVLADFKTALEQDYIWGYAPPAPAERTFPETGKTVRGLFLDFFNRYGLDICGYPITEEFEEDGVLTQYFQRVALEEYEPGRVRLKLVGTEAWESRTRIRKLEKRGPKPPIKDIVDELPKHPTKRYRARRREDITHIAVHHSAVAPSVSAERIARYHVENLDWPGIGYHFDIAADGTIYQTNELTTISYHARDANTYSIGICFAGNFTDAIPTEAQLRSGGRLIAWIMQELSIPLDHVRGHKFYVPTTACPGDQWDEGQEWKGLLQAQIEDSLAAALEKTLGHYVLFWQTAEDWAREDWLGAEEYIGRFRPTCGFSMDDAKQAEHVTIIGGPLGVPDSTAQELRASGCVVERVAGDSPEATKALLDQMAEEGKRFLTCA